jgi:hypothetical protein
MRILRSLAAGVALMSVTVAAYAQPAPAPVQVAETSPFTPEAFRSHVTFLADDLMEGREAGTRGHELAARYVATQFAGLGLQPGNGDSWYQQVTLGESTPTGPASLTVGSQTFTAGETIVFLPDYLAQPLDTQAGVVFVGYGIDAPAHGHNDYRGLDVRGKVVVMLAGLPQGLPSDVAAHLGNDRARIAAQRGAIGAIIIRPAEVAARVPMARMQTFVSRPNLTWLNAEGRSGAPTDQLRFTAVGDQALADALFAGSRRTWAQITADVAAGRRPAGFALRPTVRAQRATQNRTFTSPNVVGIIPGTDPALANEYVLISAHLDGVGIVPEGGDNQPNQAGAGEDRIRNGAMDNSTGIATLIEVARQFMRPGNRPRRPIILAAVTAEEKGLLGASYMAFNPVVQGRVVANVNLDMPILTYDFQDVVAFGAEHSTLGQAVQSAASAMGVGVSPDPLPQESLFVRSDHYSYVQTGIPAVFLMTGFAGEGSERFQAFLRGPYHSVRDDLSLPFNWQAGARFAELNYRIAREIANAPETPRWYQGSFFADAFAPGQPRATRPPQPAQPAQPAAN